MIAFPWALARGRYGVAFALSSAAIAALMGIIGQGLYPFLAIFIYRSFRGPVVLDEGSN